MIQLEVSSGISPELFVNIVVLALGLGMVGVVSFRIIKRKRMERKEIPPLGSTEPSVPRERRVGRIVRYELTRMRKIAKEKDETEDDESERIVIRRGKVRKDSVFKIIRTNVSRGMRYGTYFVDLQKLFKDGVLRWDIFYSEPIDPDTSNPQWSNELEKYLANSKRGQRIEVASMISKIEITRQMVVLMVAFGIVAGILVLNLNSIYHFTPTTIIKWFTQNPFGK